MEDNRKEKKLASVRSYATAPIGRKQVSRLTLYKLQCVRMPTLGKRL